jgi:DNA polymerase-1
MTAHVCGVALACGPGQGVYVPLGHRYLGAPTQLGLRDVAEILGPALADPALPKVGHDLKFCEVVLLRHGLTLAGVSFDTMLASYLLDPEASHELPGLAEREAGLKMVTFDTVAPKRRGQPPRGLDDVEVDEAARYAVAYPVAALAVAERLGSRLRAEKLEPLLKDLELPLATVLAEMERVGVLVDPGALEGLSEQMTKDIAALEAKAREIVGHDINLASPKQLETVLFDELSLKPLRKTKTGRSTDADVLETLAEEHALPGVVLEHRMIAKLKGTYVDAFPRLVNPETGRIHTRWGQAVAATGRTSPELSISPLRSLRLRSSSIRRATRRAHSFHPRQRCSRFLSAPGFSLLSE